jgi:hypothetical protein
MRQVTFLEMSEPTNPPKTSSESSGGSQPRQPKTALELVKEARILAEAKRRVAEDRKLAEEQKRLR